MITLQEKLSKVIFKEANLIYKEANLQEKIITEWTANQVVKEVIKTIKTTTLAELLEVLSEED